MFLSKIFAVTFDETFAKAIGVIYTTFTRAIRRVVGMRIMGTLLISSLIIFPALSSMRLFQSFKGVFVCCAFVSCFVVGLIPLLLIFHSASVVVVNLAVFLLFTLISFIRRRG